MECTHYSENCRPSKIMVKKVADNEIEDYTPERTPEANQTGN